MVHLKSIALATASLIFSTATAISTTPSAGFVSSDGAVSFALNIPQNETNNDLYFVITGPSSSSWIAIGMGNTMKDSLMFMVYADSTGKNITVSPRLSYGHVEPTYDPSISISVQPGSGINNGNYVANVLCNNCRSWKGGVIDPTDTTANFIFAAGPDGSLKSNSLTAGIRRHDDYGIFQMDLTKAVGIRGIPNPATADSSGTTQTKIKSDGDFMGLFHALFMIFTFVILMPLGVVMLRLMKSPKWHGINQAISFFLAIIGIILGMVAGTQYNRTKGFGSAHQIIGLLVTVGLIGQFVLGFMHHRIYKKTQAPTKLAPIHVWLGRIVIPLGVLNGFFGFPIALNPHLNYAYLVLILAVVIITLPFAFWRYRRNTQQARNANATVGGIDTNIGGYQSQPWQSAPSRSDVNLSHLNYPAQNYPQSYPQQDFGLHYAKPQQATEML